MKKASAFLAAALFAMAFGIPALADAADDPFYLEHMTECRACADEYETQEEAEVFVSPDSPDTAGALAAGTVVTAEQIWPSGAGWAYIEYDGLAGWLPLERCRRLYNADDFLAEHGDEIVDSEGTALIPEGAAVVFWTFPGSGVSPGSVDGSETDTGPGYSRVYTDENGGAWGLVGYFHGQHGWIYLDDITADDLPASAPRYAPEPEAEKASSPLRLPESLPAFCASCALVLAAVIGAAVLFRKRRVTPP